MTVSFGKAYPLFEKLIVPIVTQNSPSLFALVLCAINTLLGKYTLLRFMEKLKLSISFLENLVI